MHGNSSYGFDRFSSASLALFIHCRHRQTHTRCRWRNNCFFSLLHLVHKHDRCFELNFNNLCNDTSICGYCTLVRSAHIPHMWFDYFAICLTAIDNVLYTVWSFYVYGRERDILEPRAHTHTYRFHIYELWCQRSMTYIKPRQFTRRKKTTNFVFLFFCSVS